MVFLIFHVLSPLMPFLLYLFSLLGEIPNEPVSPGEPPLGVPSASVPSLRAHALSSRPSRALVLGPQTGAALGAGGEARGQRVFLPGSAMDSHVFRPAPFARAAAAATDPRPAGPWRLDV